MRAATLEGGSGWSSARGVRGVEMGTKALDWYRWVKVGTDYHRDGS